MAEYGLGRFGDRRLEKGGPFCMPAWWRRAGEAFGFADLEGAGRERSA
jgi:hypothetical protein